MMTAPQSNQELLPDHPARMARAMISLDGLSVGDAFGERFFFADVLWAVSNRAVPAPPWPYTDDTAMALSIVEILKQHGRINADLLADRFARRYREDPTRGYGGTAHDILAAIGDGVPWQDVAEEAFGGRGSMGNGGAMRVGPVGAYFADDLEAVVENARISAQVTHAHPEGQAGAIATAVAAAEAWRTRDAKESRPGRRLIETAIEHTPDGPTRQGLIAAMQLSPETDVVEAVEVLGNGSLIISPDTVPFALWCAASHLNDYEEAIWTTVSGLGDIDTTCAIVGSIVALSVGREGIPEAWLRTREPLGI